MFRFGIKRWAQALSVCLLAVIMLGAGDSTKRFNKVGHEMMCACSCGQILLECNHVGCPDSDRMIKELRVQVDAGGSNTSIMNWFAAKYGATVLASPSRGGFDNVAWIVPLALFVLATAGTAVLIAVWKRRTGLVPVNAPSAPGLRTTAMRDRIRKETEY
jgi:cytochrome c-type biogenesis protein CcmH/NrfF